MLLCESSSIQMISARVVTVSAAVNARRLRKASWIFIVQGPLMSTETLSPGGA